MKFCHFVCNATFTPRRIGLPQCDDLIANNGTRLAYLWPTSAARDGFTLTIYNVQSHMPLTTVNDITDDFAPRPNGNYGYIAWSNNSHYVLLYSRKHMRICDQAGRLTATRATRAEDDGNVAVTAHGQFLPVRRGPAMSVVYVPDGGLGWAAFP